MSATTAGRRLRSTKLAIRISSGLAALLFVPILANLADAADREAPPETAAIAGAPSYVRFEPIFVPIIENDQVKRQVGVTLMLELGDGVSQGDVEAKRMPLYDAFFRDLYGYFQDRVGVGGHVDQPYLKARLLRTTNRVMGAKLVKEVLIEQLFERPK